MPDPTSLIPDLQKLGGFKLVLMVSCWAREQRPMQWHGDYLCGVVVVVCAIVHDGAEVAQYESVGAGCA